MPDPDVHFFDTPAAFRAWLQEHHGTADVLWVGLYKKASGRPSITWPQSVAEALRFGWIDGLRKTIDDESYKIRFTPRRPGSIWSTRNIETAEQLMATGQMEPPGRAAFDRRKEDKVRRYSFERGEVTLGEEFQARFREHPGAWEFFQDQAPSYRRTITWWVISAKKRATQERRLAKLIKASEAGRRILG